MTVVSDASPLHYLVLIKAEAIGLALEMRAKTLLIDERDVRAYLHEHDPALTRFRCTAVAVSEIPRDETPARITHSGGFLRRLSRLRLSRRDSCSSIAV